VWAEPVLGVVLNNVDLKHDQNYYYYANYRLLYPEGKEKDPALGKNRRCERRDNGHFESASIDAASASVLLFALRSGARDAAQFAPGYASGEGRKWIGDPVELKISGVPAEDQPSQQQPTASDRHRLD